MIHQQIPFLNEDENVNRNFSLNLFPKLKLFEYEFPKEFFYILIMAHHISI